MKVDKATVIQLFKYGIVGASNTLITIGLFTLLNEVLGVNYIVAHIIGFGAGVVNSFYWNSRTVFKTMDNKRARFLKFTLLSLFNLGLSTGIMYLLVELLQMREIFANVISICVTMATGFIISRVWVFKKS